MLGDLLLDVRGVPGAPAAQGMGPACWELYTMTSGQAVSQAGGPACPWRLML